MNQCLVIGYFKTQGKTYGGGGNFEWEKVRSTFWSRNSKWREAIKYADWVRRDVIFEATFFSFT